MRQQLTVDGLVDGRQEELYNVEEVLGRDAASVFPTMNQQLDPMEQLKTAIGAKKFVTETEVRVGCRP